MKVFVSHFYVDYSVELEAVGATLEAAQHASEQTAKKHMGQTTLTWMQDGNRMIGSISTDDESCFIIEEVEVLTDEC